MTLIIEDGSEVANANSYVTDLEFTTYSTARGNTIPAAAADREILLIKAMDYLASLEMSWKGIRVTQTQLLSFPRYNVDLNDYILASDVIPQELKNGQMELGFQISSEEVLINETVNNLTEFNVQGVYSEKYGSSGSSQSIRTRKADAYLDQLTKNPNRLVRA